MHPVKEVACMLLVESLAPAAGVGVSAAFRSQYCQNEATNYRSQVFPVSNIVSYMFTENNNGHVSNAHSICSPRLSGVGLDSYRTRGIRTAPVLHRKIPGLHYVYWNHFWRKSTCSGPQYSHDPAVSI
jgi:hypothetical protein